MPWKPSFPGERPTLGWYVLDWMNAYLARPALGYYEPFVPYREQAQFVLDWYELDPLTCRFRYDRAVIGRPRGWGKSPILAALSAVEGLADVVPAGWDASGQPVGRPWSDFKTPLVQIAAVSEEQTSNTWQPLLEMLRDGPACDEFPGLEPLETFVNLPRGQIRQIASSARTQKGKPATAAFLDQTEEWVPSNGGPRFAQTIRTNVSKNGGRTVESPNAYMPGEQSVAEQSAEFWAKVREGRAKSESILYDHREAPPETDLADHDSLIAGLRVAYGDSSGHPGGCVIHDPPCPPGHVDLEAQVTRIWDPATDEQMARSDYLNQITHASDAWVSKPDWDARFDGTKSIADRDVVVLGFDGSAGRAKGKADATALIGCRVSDGHVFELRVWEQPDGPAGQDWEPPVVEVDAAVDAAFAMYTVVGFAADPSKWATQVAGWTTKHGRHLKVKASGKGPIEAWPGGKGSGAVQAVKDAHDAIVNGELTHDGSHMLTKHVLNARKRNVRTGYLIYKEYPDSPNKIDGAYALAMVWKMRVAALALGLGKPQKRTVRRLR